MDVIELLSKSLGSYKKSGKEFLFNCPNCLVHDGYVDRKHHLNISVDKNGVYCFRCGYGSSLVRFARRYGIVYRHRNFSSGRDRVVDISDLPEGIVFADRLLRQKKLYIRFKKEVDYLISRGISKEQLGYFGLMEGKVVAFNSMSRVSHYWIRDIDSKRFNVPSGVEKPLYFLDRVMAFRVLILAEGPFDAMAWNYGSIHTAVAMIGKTLSERQMQELTLATSRGSIQEVCIALDYGEMEARVRMSRMLPNRIKVPISFISFPDKRDADELTRSKKESLFNNRKKISLSNLLRFRK